jgi:hypothetical protein
MVQVLRNRVRAAGCVIDALCFEDRHYVTTTSRFSFVSRINKINVFIICPFVRWTLQSNAPL